MDEVVLSLFDELKSLRDEVASLRAESQTGPPTPALDGQENEAPPQDTDADPDSLHGAEDHPPPTLRGNFSTTDGQPPRPPHSYLPASGAQSSAAYGPRLPPFPAGYPYRNPGPPAAPWAAWPPPPYGNASSFSQAGLEVHQGPSYAPVIQQLLASSQPVPSSAVPHVDIVPQKIQKEILQGKDVNLAILLLPARERQYASPTPRDIKIGEEVLTLKPMKDPRLTKFLTIQEFVKSFNVYKKVMCSHYPNRHHELDSYANNIIDISTKFLGFVFYEYHLEFSARAAHLLETQHIRLDWGIVDDAMLNRLIAGRKANSCALCNAFDHQTRFCPLLLETTTKLTDTTQRDRGACYNFNSTRGCTRFKCAYPHIYSRCKSKHSVVHCKVPQIMKADERKTVNSA